MVKMIPNCFSLMLLLQLFQLQLLVLIPGLILVLLLMMKRLGKQQGKIGSRSWPSSSCRSCRTRSSSLACGASCTRRAPCTTGRTREWCSGCCSGIPDGSSRGHCQSGPPEETPLCSPRQTAASVPSLSKTTPSVSLLLVLKNQIETKTTTTKGE